MRASIFLVMLILGGISIPAVLAHGYVERTEPEDGAELSTSPEVIRVWFNESLVPDSGDISMIRSSTGAAVTVSPTLHIDATQIEAEIQETLPEGAYIVTAKATVKSDGHEPSSSFVFWVGKRAVAGNNVSESRPAYVVFALLMGLMIVAGGLSFWLLRRQNSLEVIRPSQDITHITLE
jgi:methionine-rich copper-binding protein CopC